MTMEPIALPVREARDPTRVVGVNLVDRQVSDLDDLAAQAGLSRSELLRWIIDLALPTVREAVARKGTLPPISS